MPPSFRVTFLRKNENQIFKGNDLIEKYTKQFNEKLRNIHLLIYFMFFKFSSNFIDLVSYSWLAVVCCEP